ncbi:selenoprotein P isoform X2 [Hydra vulgaris]|uniref:Selenoprotein P isoform X2 n=1 Tax=Hydra vulgaris TaxID=6087 RepID=A0ABM4BQD7_HYDVU
MDKKVFLSELVLFCSIVLLTLPTPAFENLIKNYLQKKLYKALLTNNWPKIYGRCSKIPVWNWNNTYQPVLDAAAKGHVSVLFLTKGSSKYCTELLPPLHQLAAYYRNGIGNVTFIALSYRLKKVPDKIKSLYPLINFYEEPVQSRIFSQLKANTGHFLVYDKCGRQQYHIGYPFGSFYYNLLPHAITNSLFHHITLCGKCNEDEHTLGNSTLRQNTSLTFSGTSPSVTDT